MSAKFKMHPKTGITEKFFSYVLRELDYTPLFHKWGRIGVEALSAATPVDSGETASSWSYKVKKEEGKVVLYFLNDVIVGYVSLAALIQTGHLSRSGTFVPGVDYINPAIQPIIEGLQQEIAEELDKV